MLRILQPRRRRGCVPFQAVDGALIIDDRLGASAHAIADPSEAGICSCIVGVQFDCAFAINDGVRPILAEIERDITSSPIAIVNRVGWGELDCLGVQFQGLGIFLLPKEQIALDFQLFRRHRWRSWCKTVLCLKTFAALIA